MNLAKEMFAALDASIQKWEKIYAGTGTDQGSSNCPLCQQYGNDAAVPCAECPIRIDVKSDGCAGTPYVHWDIYMTMYGPSSVKGRREGNAVFDEKSKQLALNELNYLRTLRKNLKYYVEKMYT